MRVLSGKHVFSLVAVSALVGAGLVAISTGPAAATSPCTRTYSTNLSKAIVDHTTVSSVINVPDDGLAVIDANVSVNIHHTYDADLTLTVQSETDGGAERDGAWLFDHYGGSADNLIGTVFDDEAPDDISSGSAPFTGTFNPVGSLSDLDGFSGGRYRLLVWDYSGGDQGTIDNWSVTLTYATCDVDNDGLDVPTDLCPNTAAATASGCPVATRAVTAKYKKGKFRGAISSSAAKCRSGMKVVIWKARAGADRKIGTATTRSDGTYRLTRARHVGKYYAKTAKVVVANVAECSAATSPTFRIK